MDLDVDIDIGDMEDSTSMSAPRTPTKSWKQAKPTSPGAKSVDMGCVNMKYYDDYQVLDISPFLEKGSGKNVTAFPKKSPEKKLSYAIIPPLHEKPIEALNAGSIEDTGLNKELDIVTGEGSPSTQPQSFGSRKDSRPVILTMEDFERTSRVRSPELITKDSAKPMLVHHISMIKEEDDDEQLQTLTDTLDEVKVSDSGMDVGSDRRKELSPDTSITE
jgi:hypothetical protein